MLQLNHILFTHFSLIFHQQTDIKFAIQNRKFPEILANNFIFDTLSVSIRFEPISDVPMRIMTVNDAVMFDIDNTIVHSIEM